METIKFPVVSLGEKPLAKKEQSKWVMVDAAQLEAVIADLKKEMEESGEGIYLTIEEKLSDADYALDRFKSGKKVEMRETTTWPEFRVIGEKTFPEWSSVNTERLEAVIADLKKEKLEETSLAVAETIEMHINDAEEALSQLKSGKKVEMSEAKLWPKFRIVER